MIKKYHVSKNLFDKNATDTTKGYISGKYLVYTGSTTSNSAFCISEYIPVTPNTSYTLVYGSNNDAPAICFYDIDYNYIIGYKYDTRYVVTETAPNGAAFCRLSYIENNKDQVMLNEGSIALPYEPYYTPYFSEEPYRKRETATDTITTLPKQIIGDGQPIGANLCNISTYTASGQTSKYEYFWNVILSAGTYTFSCRQNNILSSATRNTLFVVIDSNFTYESTAINYHLNEGLHSLTFTLESKKTIMLGCWTNTISNDCVYDEFMLNVGSTALPYQPYAPTIIKGNLSQSGAPTPTTPIYPSECGERTGNLIEFKNKTQEIREVTLTILNGQVSFNGTASQSGGRLTQVSEDIVLESGSYKLSHIENGTVPSYLLQSKSDSTKYYTAGQAFTLSSKETFYISFSFAANIAYSGSSKVMLNTGSTPLSYEPYGYKLPILSGDTITNVYLGEVQSTRKIYKYAFTGQETVYEYDANNGIYRFRLSELSIERLSSTGIIVSHFSKSISTAEIQDGQYSIGTNYIYLRITNITSGSNFATYLQQQYAAGTPVTLWYVLATPQTTTLNEPIRKIGNYADSVSVSNIPTTGTAESFDIDTTLKPSEVDLTYHGWHEHSDTKYT